MTAIPNKPTLFTAKEVAEYLGLALNSVYALRDRGRLPAEPHGERSWRWTQAAIDAYRQSHTPANAVPADQLALIRAAVADALTAVAAELRGPA